MRFFHLKIQEFISLILLVIGKSSEMNDCVMKEDSRASKYTNGNKSSLKKTFSVRGKREVKTDKQLKRNPSMNNQNSIVLNVNMNDNKSKKIEQDKENKITVSTLDQQPVRNENYGIQSKAIPSQNTRWCSLQHHPPSNTPYQSLMNTNSIPSNTPCQNNIPIHGIQSNTPCQNNIPIHGIQSNTQYQYHRIQPSFNQNPLNSQSQIVINCGNQSTVNLKENEHSVLSKSQHRPVAYKNTETINRSKTFHSFSLHKNYVAPRCYDDCEMSDQSEDVEIPFIDNSKSKDLRDSKKMDSHDNPRDSKKMDSHDNLQDSKKMDSHEDPQDNKNTISKRYSFQTNFEKYTFNLPEMELPLEGDFIDKNVVNMLKNLSELKFESVKINLDYLKTRLSFLKDENIIFIIDNSFSMTDRIDNSFLNMIKKDLIFTKYEESVFLFIHMIYVLGNMNIKRFKVRFINNPITSNNIGCILGLSNPVNIKNIQNVLGDSNLQNIEIKLIGKNLTNENVEYLVDLENNQSIQNIYKMLSFLPLGNKRLVSNLYESISLIKKGSKEKPFRYIVLTGNDPVFDTDDKKYKDNANGMKKLFEKYFSINKNGLFSYKKRLNLILNFVLFKNESKEADFLYQLSKEKMKIGLIDYLKVKGSDENSISKIICDSLGRQQILNNDY